MHVHFVQWKSTPDKNTHAYIYSHYIKKRVFYTLGLWFPFSLECKCACTCLGALCSGVMALSCWPCVNDHLRRVQQLSQENCRERGQLLENYMHELTILLYSTQSDGIGRKSTCLDARRELHYADKEVPPLSYNNAWKFITLAATAQVQRKTDPFAYICSSARADTM
jgi:hypothetical protein